MATLDYRKLWINGGYARDNPLERSLAYVGRCADGAGLSREKADRVIHSVFQEIADGRQFSLVQCSCGCGIDRSGTDAIHYMVKKIHEAAQLQSQIPYLRKVVTAKKMGRIRRAYRILVGREI